MAEKLWQNQLLCPMRKQRVSMGGYEYATKWEEKFLPCIKGQCAWWDKKGNKCSVAYGLWVRNNFNMSK